MNMNTNFTQTNMRICVSSTLHTFYYKLLRGNIPQTHNGTQSTINQGNATCTHMHTHTFSHHQRAANHSSGQTEAVFRVHFSAGGSSQIHVGSSHSDTQTHTTFCLFGKSHNSVITRKALSWSWFPWDPLPTPLSCDQPYSTPQMKNAHTGPAVAHTLPCPPSSVLVKACVD